MEKVTKYRCSFCEEELTQEQYESGDYVGSCGCTWCGPDCCDAYPESYQVDVPESEEK